MSISEIIFFAAELIGTAAFSIAGTLIAIRHELDIFGAVVVGTVTAVGGGCVRDILLGQFPPAMFITPIYAAMAAVLAMIVFALEYIITARKILESKTYETVVNIFDALGLAIFVVVGINTAETSGYADNAFLSICVGVLTGIGGGIMRDLFVGTVPMVLRKQVYALPAIVGGIIYYYMIHFNTNNIIAVIVTIVLIMTVRILAAHFRWDLPKIKQQEK